MNYNEIYQRNIGSFTTEEQERFKSAHVFIAGVGGVGGIQAVNLVRMGIGEITIMDPGIYDVPDLNRQYGAMHSTIGRNKAVVMGEILREVAPLAKIEVFDRKLSRKDLKKEIEKCSEVAINAIDLSDFKYNILFSQIAREENKYSLLCPIPDFAAVLMIFAPGGMTFEEFTNSERFPPITPSAKKRDHRGVYGKDEIQFLSGISSNSGAGSLSGGVLATEVTLIITGKRKKEDIVCAPFIKYIDLLDNFFKIINPLE